MEYTELDQTYGTRREEEIDDCEYEVTKQAMEMYCKYPCYAEWTPFLYGEGRNNYLQHKRVLVNGSRGKVKYKGAYLLKNEEDTLILTADILTEIKSPIKKIVINKDKINSKSVKGEDIIKGILDNTYKFEKDIGPYIVGFALVYYWVGNMLPVISNPQRLNDRGTWRNKILYLCGRRRNNENEKNWPQWKEWRLPENWIEDFYLQDAFNGEYVVKPFYCGLEAENQVYFSKLKNFNQGLWFLNNTKFIIQRSYRIVNEFNGDWSDINEKCGRSHEECVKEIVESIFKKANIPEYKSKIDIF